MKRGIEVARKGGNILVVDDEQSILDVLRDILDIGGFAVDCTSDSFEAIRLIEDGKYDLVLTDIRMPKIDGRELYGIIVEKAPSLKRKVVFITGDVIAYDMGELKGFIEDTGCRYLPKPFRPKGVLDLVNKLLHR